jgi:hypothetical protein
MRQNISLKIIKKKRGKRRLSVWAGPLPSVAYLRASAKCHQRERGELASPSAKSGVHLSIICKFHCFIREWLLNIIIKRLNVSVILMGCNLTGSVTREAHANLTLVSVRPSSRSNAHNETKRSAGLNTGPQKEKVLVIVSDGRRDVWIISSEVN